MKFLVTIIIACVCLQACTVNKAKIDNSLENYFKKNAVEGCFTMLDNSTGKIVIYNMAMDTSRVLPSSTFDIVNGLIGLETGKIIDENMLIKWDGVARPNTNWNKDLTFTEAFKINASPYFMQVAKNIGADSMKMYIDTLSYGNKLIKGALDTFWMNNSIKISPDEQLGLLKRLYFDQLPFRKSVQQQLRDVMIKEDNTSYKLSYTEGIGKDEQSNSNNWIVGWIEENRHVYFFAQLIKATPKNEPVKELSISILKNILKQYDFFEGKK